MSDSDSFKKNLGWVSALFGILAIVVPLVFAGILAVKSYVDRKIEASINGALAVSLALQEATLLIEYDYPEEAITKLRSISHQVDDLKFVDDRKRVYYDAYLNALASSDDVLEYSPDIQKVRLIFNSELPTYGWHEENLAWVSLFLKEASASKSFREREVFGRLVAAKGKYRRENRFVGVASANHVHALALLCFGQREEAKKHLAEASERFPFRYYVEFPSMGPEALQGWWDGALLDEVCQVPVSAEFVSLLNELRAESSKFSDFLGKLK